MPVIVTALGGVVIGGLLLFGWLAGARIRRYRSGSTPPAGETAWPSAALIVPLADGLPESESGVRTLLEQEYPDLLAVLVTREREDEAGVLARRLAEERKGVLHVAAGLAVACGQKNWNLLAGVKAAGPRPVLVFADAGHRAPPGWLQALVAPIAAGRAKVTTSYHHVTSVRPGVAAAGFAVTALILYLLHETPGLSQPWGGSMAMAREAFDGWGISELWGRTVVDDVTLAAEMGRRGERVCTVPQIWMLTVRGNASLRGWLAWLSRQLAYLRFYVPAAWVGIGALIWGLALGGAAGCAQALRGGMCLAGAGFPAGILVLVVLLRRLHPRPGPVLPWIGASALLLPVACAAHLRTCFSQSITWRDARYALSRQGTVEGVERMEESRS